MSLLERFYQKDELALSRLISYVENQAPDYYKVLSSIYSELEKPIGWG